MITDARVLRAGFVPREVEHRDAEVTHLTEILAPLTDGDPADTTLLVGPSGVGKTCLANYTAQKLRQEVLDVEYQYVNCWQNFSEFRAVYRILEGLGKTVDVHRQSTPRDELFERLRRYAVSLAIDGEPDAVFGRDGASFEAVGGDGGAAGGGRRDGVDGEKTWRFDLDGYGYCWVRTD